MLPENYSFVKDRMFFFQIKVEAFSFGSLQNLCKLTAKQTISLFSKKGPLFFS